MAALGRACEQREVRQISGRDGDEAGAAQHNAGSSTAAHSRRSLAGCAIMLSSQVDVLMGLHAFRAGQFLLPLQRQFQLPLLLVLGQAHAKAAHECNADSANNMRNTTDSVYACTLCCCLQAVRT